MISLFNKGNIRKAVMAVVNKRIEEAQRKHDTELVKLNDERLQKIAQADVEYDNKKVYLEETIVQEVLGKIL
jgi:hypothetical protein